MDYWEQSRVALTPEWVNGWYLNPDLTAVARAGGRLSEALSFAPETCVRNRPSVLTRLRLVCGTRTLIRPILAQDAAALATGMQRLSQQSRVQRFHHHKSGLSEKELRHLTDCDGVNHIAFGVALIDRHGHELDGVAVAHCFRLKTNPLLAEVAIVVLDEWQARGLGSVLIRVLAAQAWEAGIRRWQAYYYSDNVGVKKLLAGVGAKAREGLVGGGTVEAFYDLYPPRSRSGGS